MRILVTGATGFTGRHFISLAKAAGHQTVALDADITDRDAVRCALNAINPLDAVMHLAGIAFVGHADSTSFYDVNTVGTSNLLHALATQSNKPHFIRVLIASSANVYGNCEQSPITEDQTPAPINHYAASKLAMEHMALTYTNRMEIVIARPFNYTGPGQSTSFLIPKIVDHFIRKAEVIELGNLQVEREFNDVRMVCEAYLDLLDHGVSGQIYNVCTGQAHTLESVVDTLKEMTGHHPRIKVNPALVRANEVQRLCGSTSRLTACIGALPSFNLTDTLKNMMDAKCAHCDDA